MKSFWTGAAAAALIAVIAGAALNMADSSSASKFSTESVRLK